MLKCVFKNPNAKHSVLPSRGQQSAAGGEFHAPNWSLMFPAQILYMLQAVEVVRSLVAIRRLQFDVLLPGSDLVHDIHYIFFMTCVRYLLSCFNGLGVKVLTETLYLNHPGLFIRKKKRTSCAIDFALSIVFFIVLPKNFLIFSVFRRTELLSVSFPGGISDTLLSTLSSSDSFSFSKLVLLLTYSDVSLIM